MDNEAFEIRRNTIMMTLLDRKGMKHIISTAAEVFGNPIFVSDVSLNVLCFSDTECEDPFWNIVKTARFADENILKECSRGGAFNELYSSDEPQLVRFNFTDKPFLAARIRDGVNVLAHVNVYACMKDFDEDDAELLIVLSKVLAYEMLYRGKSYSAGISYYGIMSELLSCQFSTISGVMSRASNSKLVLPSKYRLAVIRCGENEKKLLFYLRDRIASELYGSSPAIIFRDDLIVIFDVSEERAEHNLMLIEKATADKGYRTAVSCRALALDEIKSSYDKAVGLLNAYTAFGRVLYYDKDFLYHVFSQLNDAELRSIVGDEIELLRLYDEKNGASLLPALRAYLESGRNINLAAQKLFIHKNSMYYRKSRIEELLDLKLDDEDVCFSLEVKLKMAGYLENRK